MHRVDIEMGDVGYFPDHDYVKPSGFWLRASCDWRELDSCVSRYARFLLLRIS